MCRVFRNWKLSGLSVLIAVLALTVSVWVSNVSLIWTVVSSNVSLSTKGAFLLSLYGTLGTNFSPVSAVTTVLICILIGINTSLLVHYIRHRRSPGNNKAGHSAGVLGFVSGVFGIGCAACGSVILTGIFSSLGALTLLSVLPLHGAEFGLLGVGLLGYSIYQLTKRIADPLVCPVA